ncbi:peptidoglycan-binding protein [Brevibacterium sp. FAM 25378]|uniref:peptidoglycan-binding protein n=1 Tax=unclassified Brevibacterium TaxID=2614124 RepID=UPI00143D6AC8|nr:peptidoglycan-binding protein [Brevibacterium sp. S22]
MAATIAAALLACATIVAVAFLHEPPATETPDPKPPATDRVIRDDLVQNSSIDGQLAFQGAKEIKAQKSGVLTWVPKTGKVLEFGDKMYGLDGAGVYMLEGEIPAWRDFRKKMSDGPDVRQLEESLSRLGFFPYRIDNHFDDYTERAIKNWQESIGQTTTGVITLGQVQFVDGKLRADEQIAGLGDQIGPGSPVLKTTDNTQAVKTDISEDQQSAIKVDAVVSIDLPDGESIKGTIAKVGAPAEKPDSNGAKKTIYPVTIALKDRDFVADTPSAKVTVNIQTILRSKVLQVPVESLMAQPGGGFVVQVLRSGGTTDEVSLQLGTFLDGQVEIKKGALKEGDKIVVPSI